jgi:hypothetical protein
LNYPEFLRHRLHRLIVVMEISVISVICEIGVYMFTSIRFPTPLISTPKTTTIRNTFTVLFLETFICLSDFNPDDNNDRTIIQTCLGRIH